MFYVAPERVASEAQPLPPRGRGSALLSRCARKLAAAIFLGCVMLPAAAVPVPYKNCGHAGDILSVAKLDASVWPPPTAAPLAGVATIDPVTGALTNLHLLLPLAVNWTFDSGNLATGLQYGFVALPASVPLTITSPPLPVAAGPYTATRTFSSGGGGGSVIVVSSGNVAQSIPAALTDLSLTFNGNSGFPVPPMPGSYEARIRMTLPDGEEIFCVDFALTNVSFVTAAASVQVPALSRYTVAVLLLLLAASGMLVLSSRYMQR